MGALLSIAAIVIASKLFEFIQYANRSLSSSNDDDDDDNGDEQAKGISRLPAPASAAVVAAEVVPRCGESTAWFACHHDQARPCCQLTAVEAAAAAASLRSARHSNALGESHNNGEGGACERRTSALTLERNNVHERYGCRFASGACCSADSARSAARLQCYCPSSSSFSSSSALVMARPPRIGQRSVGSVVGGANASATRVFSRQQQQQQQQQQFANDFSPIHQYHQHHHHQRHYQSTSKRQASNIDEICCPNVCYASNHDQKSKCEILSFERMQAVAYCDSTRQQQQPQQLQQQRQQQQCESADTRVVQHKNQRQQASIVQQVYKVTTTTSAYNCQHQPQQQQQQQYCHASNCCCSLDSPRDYFHDDDAKLTTRRNLSVKENNLDKRIAPSKKVADISHLQQAPAELSASSKLTRRVSKQTTQGAPLSRQENLRTKTSQNRTTATISKSSSSSSNSSSYYPKNEKNKDIPCLLDLDLLESSDSIEVKNTTTAAAANIHTSNLKDQQQQVAKQIRALGKVSGQPALCSGPIETPKVRHPQAEEPMTVLISSQKPPSTTVATEATVTAAAATAAEEETKNNNNKKRQPKPSRLKRKLQRQSDPVLLEKVEQRLELLKQKRAQKLESGNKKCQPLGQTTSNVALAATPNIITSQDKLSSSTTTATSSLRRAPASDYQLNESPPPSVKINVTRTFYNQSNNKSNKPNPTSSKKSSAQTNCKPSSPSSSSSLSPSTHAFGGSTAAAMAQQQTRVACGAKSPIAVGGASGHLAQISGQQGKQSYSSSPSTSSLSSSSTCSSLSPPPRPQASSTTSARQQQQQSTRFTFDRNLIRTREHRSLSTSSSMTTDSSESSGAAAGSSSSAYSASSSANCSPASSGYSSTRVTTNGSASKADRPQQQQQQQQHRKSVDIRIFRELAPVEYRGMPAPGCSAAPSLLHSDHEQSKLSKIERSTLHPAVSALLLSTANLSLSRQTSLPSAATILLPPPPKKKSKKMQAQQSPSNLHSTSSSSLSSASPPPPSSSPSSPSSTTTQSPDHLSPSSITRNSYIQDATYLARSPSFSSGVELSPLLSLAALEAPPRPWLKPEEQLNYLPKTTIKARARKLRREQALEMISIDRSQDLPEVAGGRVHLQRQQQQQEAPPTSLAFLSTSSIIADKQHHHHCEASEFTILSYNVLSDRMVNTERFPASPDLALNWLYRRELILRQLLEHKADVIALQELEWEQYETFFKPKLESLVDVQASSSSPSSSSSSSSSCAPECHEINATSSSSAYCGIFEPKSRARTMDAQMRRRVDGCAIFYKRSKFKLVARHLLEFNQIAMANARGSEAMLNRVMTKDNIGLVAVLELRTCGQQSISASATLDDCGQVSDLNDELSSSRKQDVQQTPRRLVVCNTHIHWNPDSCDVKLVQTIMLMNELKHIARHYANGPYGQSKEDLNNNNSNNNCGNLVGGGGGSLQGDVSYAPPQLLPLVLTGDFNSLPKSGVLDFLLNANIESSHKDFKDIKYGECSNALALKGCSIASDRSLPVDATSKSHDESIGQFVAQRTLGSMSITPPGFLRRASQQPQQLASSECSESIASSRILGASLNLGRDRTLDSQLSRRLSSPVTAGAATPTWRQITPMPLFLDRDAQQQQQQQQKRQASEAQLYEHPFKLASAYERGVMPFTSFTTKFKATIDYIFFDQQQVDLLGLLGPLDKSWLKANKIKGFPQLQFPSDHLPLLARFRLRASVSPAAATSEHQVDICGVQAARLAHVHRECSVERSSLSGCQKPSSGISRLDSVVLSNKNCHKDKF